jgi:hypothetical protein
MSSEPLEYSLTRSEKALLRRINRRFEKCGELRKMIEETGGPSDARLAELVLLFNQMTALRNSTSEVRRYPKSELKEFQGTFSAVLRFLDKRIKEISERLNTDRS